jgi:hypothetical protein
MYVKQENNPRDFVSEWNCHVRTSIKEAGLPEPELVILESPYRKVVSPILDHIWKLERENPGWWPILPALWEKRCMFFCTPTQIGAGLKTGMIVHGIRL